MATYFPTGPFKEWTTYRQILEGAGMNSSFYYDMPGNHDHYNDKIFSYYRANSIQGVATGKTQPSWTRQFPYGNYHFLGVCTPGNDGAPFSIDPEDYFGDHSGLDFIELAEIQGDLASHTDAQLTLIFGHHNLSRITSAVRHGLNLRPAYLHGADRAVPGPLLRLRAHPQLSREPPHELLSLNLTKGIYYMNVASLGKSAQNQYAVMAIDGNGLSSCRPKRASGRW